MRNTISHFLAALVLSFALTNAASGHDLPVNSIMNAFVKVESDRLDLVVRVPLDLLRGVPFPVRNSLYDVAAAGPATEIALLLLEEGFVVVENGTPLKPVASNARLSPESDRSFGAYESSLALTQRPPDRGTNIVYDKGFLDVHFAYPISSPRSLFKIQSQVAADLGNGAMLTVRYLDADDAGRALIMRSGEEPAPLNPTWYQAAGSFILLGVEHILTGTDHLLFLFCLVIPFRSLRRLISVITAFTVAHSVTLFASAFHLAPQGAWFAPFVEMAIAASIVYTAIENVVQGNLRRRWLIAGMFGLVHGFGFSNALGQSLQFAGSHLLLSLFAFNIGIELGQLAVLALMLPALALLRRVVPDRMAIVTLSACVAIVGAYWVVERWEALRRAPWELDGSAFLAIGCVAFIVVALFAAVTLLSKRSSSRPPAAGESFDRTVPAQRLP